MRYVMRQRLFALRDAFVVRDERGQERYVIDGAPISLTDRLTVRDTRRRELAQIRRRLFAWGPTYDVLRGGAPAAVITKRRFSLSRCVLTVDVPGPDDLEAVGDLLSHEYTIRPIGSGPPVAHVSRKWWTLADTYGIDIAPGADEVLILCAAVVIDLACHDHDGGLLGFSG